MLEQSELEENVVTQENVVKKRALSPIQSPVKARNPVESLPVESNSTSPTRKSKRQRIEAPKIVESKLEPKVYLNKAGKHDTCISFWTLGFIFNGGLTTCFVWNRVLHENIVYNATYQDINFYSFNRFSF